jgi:transcription termination factor Rho
MPVFDRSELEASPLADLHAIADQVGLEGFRRLRKAELIDAILAGPGGAGGDDDADEDVEGVRGADGEAPNGARPRRRSARARRSRRATSPASSDEREDEVDAEAGSVAPRRGAAGSGRSSASEARSSGQGKRDEGARDEGARGEGARVEGVVELLGNGSAFLRVNPPEPDDEDVYVSAAQVRRCELVTGDRVSGPLRPARRSERHPSLVRVEEINGAPAGEVAEGPHYDERPVAYPSERLALDGGDATLEAIEWLTPFGKGSRAVIVGPARAGKTELIKRLASVLVGREDLPATLVLAGVRPEEIAEWSEGSLAPAVTLTFAAAADAQGQAVERALDLAKRAAARGGDALVVIDTLDGLHPHTARKVLAAARNLRDGGSLTILATASKPFGGETTVIALDPALAGAAEGAGAPALAPALDLAASGTLRAELLVGEEGAAAIAKARANALAHAHGS